MGRSWPALLLVSVVAVAVGAIAEMASAEFVRLALPAEYGWVHQVVPGRQYSVLGAETGLVRTVLEGAAFAFGFGAAAHVTAAALAAERISAGRALLLAAWRMGTLTLAYLAFGAVALALSVVSFPLLLLAPIGVPVAVAGLVLWALRPGRRGLARWMVVLGLPFGWLIETAVLLAVALPAAAIDREGPIASLRSSRRLVRGHWFPAALTVAGIAVAVLGLTLGAGLLVSAISGAFQPVGAAAPPTWATIVFQAIAVLVSQVPAVALTALYLLLRDGPEDTALEAAPSGLWPRRPGMAVAAALISLLASLASPGGVAFAAAAPPAVRPAASTPSVPPQPSAAPAPRRNLGPNYVVSSLADSGAGSLRDAIAQADTAGVQASITFSASGTITLASTLSLTAPATIDGAGQAVVISGNDLVPILTTAFNAVTISNLSLVHGNAAPGSGLAGGFTSGGGANTFSNVTFSANHGDVAGALYNRGLTTVTGSTFAGNGATNGGGALTAAESVQAINDTFTSNGGPSPTNGVGGAITVLGSLTGNGLTVVQSTGGGIVWSNNPSPFLSLSNSLLDSNGNGDCFGFGVPAGSGNSDSDNSCGGGGGQHGPNYGYAQNLASNGVSTTQTLALLPGSAAIGHGNPASCPASDQRGVARPLPASCDSGAYQFRPDVNVAFTTDRATYNLGNTAALTATITPVYEGGPVQLIQSGDVTFYDGTSSLGSGTISGNQATLGYSGLAIGPHTLTAHYNGMARGWAAAVSAPVNVTVIGSLSTITVGSSLNPSTTGDSVTFTATLSSGSANSATGNIDFLDGGTVLATVPVASDSAAYATSALAVGHHSITVYYHGDSTHGTATSPAVDQSVRDLTTTTATLSPGSNAYFGTPSLSVTVTSPTGVPSGTVSCRFGSVYSFGTLDGAGHTTCSGAGFAPGTGSVSVSYPGDNPTLSAGHSGSSTSVALTVNAATTTQSLTSNVASPVFGQPVTLTATVSSAVTTAVPTGTIDFQRSGVTFASVTLDGTGAAQAAVPASQLPLGLNGFSSVYHPAVGFAAAGNGSLAVTVATAPTTVALQASPASAVYGQAVTLTATVTAGGGSAATPTGSILLSDGAAFNQTVVLTGSGTSATAVSSPTLALGGHAITASYLSDPGFAAGMSPTVNVAVVNALTTSTLAASPPSSSAYGDPVTLTATVVPVAPGAGSPTGSVRFYDGATPLGSVALSGGRAAFTVSLPGVGGHSWSAAYAGDGNYGGSTSTAIAFTVGADQPLVTATGSPTGTYGSPVTVNAHVANLTNSTPVVGSVTFTAFPANHLLGTVSVDASGNASLTSSTVPGDTNDIQVLFVATPQFLAAVHDVPITMSRATPTGTVSVSPNPGVIFGTVTISSTMAGVSPGDFPTGAVTPYLDGASLGPDFLNNGSITPLTIASPSIGYHTVTVAYAGNTDYAPLATFASYTFYVNGADPGLTLTANPSPAGIGVPYTLTATVSWSNYHLPTGTVTFSDGNGQVGAPVALSAAGTATSAPSSWPFAGTETITAIYSGDSHFAPTTVTHPLTVQQLATTTIAGVNTTPPWLVGQPITLAASVSSAAPVTSGQVIFFDGPYSLGPPAPVSNGVATLTVSALAQGAHPITAHYSDGPGFAQSISPVYTVQVSGHPSLVTLSSSPASPIAGQAAQLTVHVTASDSATQIPSGAVNVSDGSLGCNASAPQGSCYITWPSTGVRTLTASYSGDGNFAPASAQLVVDVVRNPPNLVASLAPGARWIAGESIAVNWSMAYASPPPTGTVNVLNASGQGCLSQPVSGTCNVPIPALAGAQAITLTYSGDSLYAPATATVSGTALACHLFWVSASPVGWGGFDQFPATGDCMGGRGMADGDSVLVIPQPTAHHRFLGFDGYPATVTYLNLTVTQDTGIIGRFDYICDTVTVEHVTNAQWYPVTSTDCGSISQNPVTKEVYLPYHDGEAFTLQGQDFTDPTWGLYSFKGWYDYSGPFYPGANATITATPGLVLVPDIVRPCYHLAISIGNPAGGTVAVSDGLGGLDHNCYAPDGSRGWTYNSTIYLTVTERITDLYAAGVPYPVSIQNPSYNLVGITIAGTDARQAVQHSYSSHYSMTLHGDDTLNVGFQQCRAITVDADPQYAIVNRTLVLTGRVTAAGSACHDGGGNPVNGWFAGPVTVTAAAQNGFHFYTWHGDTRSGLTPALNPTGGPDTLTLDGGADHHLTATFGAPDSCYPVPLELGAASFDRTAAGEGWAGVVPTSPYGSITIGATTPEHTYGHGYCPPQLYEAGSTIQVDLAPGGGVFSGFMGRRLLLNPDGSPNNFSTNLVGPLGQDGTPLAGSDVGRPQEQTFITLPPAGGGAVIAQQVWFCYPVVLSQVALSPNGTPFQPPLAMVSFDASSAAGHCPIASFAFLPGSTVSATETPQPGYTFKDWSGTTSGTGATARVTVNSPQEMDATFNGACFSLTVDDVNTSSGNDPDDSTRSDTPNCPGYPDSAGRYLAGTVVALQAADHGQQTPFQGWEGADTASGMLAIVTMDADHALHAHYNDDLAHPTASASAFGTYMSAVGKATVGVIATALSSYVINFTSAGLIGLAGTIGDGLGKAGVPYAGQIGTIMNDLSATLTGPLDCVGTWGLSNGSDYAPSNALTQGAGTAKTVASSANTAANTAAGQGALGGLAQKIDAIKSFSQENAATLSDAQKTTYALKWVAMGVQVGMQLSTMTVSADWSMSSFENQMSSCLSNRGDQLNNAVTGI